MRMEGSSHAVLEHKAECEIVPGAPVPETDGQGEGSLRCFLYDGQCYRESPEGGDGPPNDTAGRQREETWCEGLAALAREPGFEGGGGSLVPQP